MPGAPKKSKSTEAKTAQTGMMSELDPVRPGYRTPKKGVDPEEDYDEENIRSVDVSLPTAEEAEIAARNEKLRKALLTAKGGKHRKHRKMRKTRKLKRKNRA